MILARGKAAAARTFRDKEPPRSRIMNGLGETAARAMVTATVSFAAGWLLKRIFEKKVEEVAAKAVDKPPISRPPDRPMGYRRPTKSRRISNRIAENSRTDHNPGEA